MAKLKIQWSIDDGYAGRDRPQYASIDAEDILECWDEEELIGLIQDLVTEEFNQRISYGADQSSIDELVKFFRENKVNKDNGC